MLDEPHCSPSDVDVEQPLKRELVPDRDAISIRLTGTLDLASVQELEDQLAELQNTGFRRLIVDLRGLQFMDSFGLRLILRWDAAARTDGFAFGVIAGPPRIQRVFELTKTLEFVRFVDAA